MAKKTAKPDDVQPACVELEASPCRATIVAQVACGLLQSPRFSARIMREEEQDALVDAAVKIADKIIAATA